MRVVSDVVVEVDSIIVVDSLIVDSLVEFAEAEWLLPSLYP